MQIPKLLSYMCVSVCLCLLIHAWQHWFQNRIHEGIQSGERQCRPSQPCPACLDPEHTLVVAMWRNPYDWIAAMSKMPWHAKVWMVWCSVVTVALGTPTCPVICSRLVWELNSIFQHTYRDCIRPIFIVYGNRISIFFSRMESR